VEVVYKILTPPEWEEAIKKGVFAGSAADVRDGFIHFSTAEQIEETVKRHYSGPGELFIAAVEADTLGMALRWESSRGGALFPHLYGPLWAKDILWTKTFEAGSPSELRRLLAE